MLTYDDAIALIDAIALRRQIERVGIDHAYNRILAEDVRLGRDQPPFDRATMDGYAIALPPAGAPPFPRYRVVGSIMAGAVYSGTVAPGQAVRIMTGAPCPAGTTVVPIEAIDRHSSGDAESVAVTDPKMLPPSPAQRRNVALRAQDGAAGAVVVCAGTRLTPVTISVSAMAGARDLAVIVPPRLAIVTTGDELAAPPASGTAADASARIHDSNGPLLSAFAAALGLPHSRTRAPDDANALQAELGNAAAIADIVVTTGGVSAGDKDLVPTAAAALGYQTVFHHIALQPGKPVFLARKGDRFIVGLPGNPVSVLATAHLVLWPLLARFGGVAGPAWKTLPMAVDWRNRGDRRLFLPAMITRMGVEPIAWNGSGDLIAAGAGDCLLDLAPRSTCEPGVMVRVLPYVGGQNAERERGVLPERPARTNDRRN
ncbi:MAG: molybdopterin molybdotransferase MoeA [Planctomycetes bacterium]|nr:molybdopterin molybdotransferase MoeA [Planctomycetota bacterium]